MNRLYAVYPKLASYTYALLVERIKELIKVEEMTTSTHSELAQKAFGKPRNMDFKGGNQRKGKPSGSCDRCGKTGHYIKDCKTDPNLTCGYCDRIGHLRAACRKRIRDEKEKAGHKPFNQGKAHFKREHHGARKAHEENVAAQALYYTDEYSEEGAWDSIELATLAFQVEEPLEHIIGYAHADVSEPVWEDEDEDPDSYCRGDRYEGDEDFDTFEKLMMLEEDDFGEPEPDCFAASLDMPMDQYDLDFSEDYQLACLVNEEEEEGNDEEHSQVEDNDDDNH